MPTSDSRIEREKGVLISYTGYHKYHKMQFYIYPCGTLWNVKFDNPVRTYIGPKGNLVANLGCGKKQSVALLVLQHFDKSIDSIYRNMEKWSIGYRDGDPSNCDIDNLYTNFHNKDRMRELHPEVFEEVISE